MMAKLKQKCMKPGAVNAMITGWKAAGLYLLFMVNHIVVVRDKVAEEFCVDYCQLILLEQHFTAHSSTFICFQDKSDHTFVFL